MEIVMTLFIGSWVSSKLPWQKFSMETQEYTKLKGLKAQGNKQDKG